MNQLQAQRVIVGTTVVPIEVTMFDNDVQHRTGSVSRSTFVMPPGTTGSLKWLRSFREGQHEQLIHEFAGTFGPFFGKQAHAVVRGEELIDLVSFSTEFALALANAMMTEVPLDNDLKIT